jgi:hypothetical protein
VFGIEPHKLVEASGGAVTDRNNRQDAAHQMAIAASQTAAVSTVLPLDDAL